MEKQNNNIPENNDLDENGFFLLFVKLMNYMKIILSPLLVGFAIDFILISFYNYNWKDMTVVLIILAGFVVGVLLAETIRRKHNLTDYGSSLSETPDVDEWIKKHREEHGEKKKNN
ncbi:MAG: hypothetical protein ACOZCO_13575 [Bacteroidota bacterium]